MEYFNTILEEYEVIYLNRISDYNTKDEINSAQVNLLKANF